ncbi:hypothetical protein GY45DRAFT_1369779 [Cubamyces sp. BRFM 1775]|nr:hypothetical protein GY45DRAFT_1369779 [Cubamyces sp. BRFM 1775]
MEIVIYLPIGIFAALRALALSRMNWKVAVLVFILASGPFAVNLWIYIGAGIYGLEIPVVGCATASNETAHEARIGEPATRVPSDILVLATTWWYATNGGATWRTRGTPGCRSSLMKAMILHGTTYFLALLTLNSLHLTLTMLSVDITAQQAVSLVPLFTDPLTVIIICRFLLGLQCANVKITGQETADSQLGRAGEYGGSLHFASLAIVNSMGGAVDVGHSESSMDDGRDHSFSSTLTPTGQTEEYADHRSQLVHV